MVHNNDSTPEDDDDNGLISSLERHGTATFSESSTWKIRTNQLALEYDDIRRDRRAAIASGKLKCRRLSYDDDVVDIDIDDDIAALDNHFSQPNFCNDQIFVVPEFGKQIEEELPVCLNALSFSSASVSSSSSSSSSSSPICNVLTEQIAANANVEENASPMSMPTPTPIVAENIETQNWYKFGKRKVGLAWLAVIAWVVFSVCCLGYRAYDEQQQLPFLLVPT